MHFHGCERNRPPRHTWLIFIFALLAFTTATDAQDRALGADAAPNQLLADRLAQEALYCLERIEGEPREDQFVCAAILMDMALELNAQDAELWRSRRELAQLMGDSRAEENALKAYIRLRPSDDAAQLDLILSRFNRLPTLDERLSLLERILASGSASSLSESLRSRLESYAAISARELGDNVKFIEHLKQAVKLDPANETAATLTYEHVRDSGGTPVQMGSVNVSLIKASPLSSAARLNFATILAGEAAYQRAAEQFQLAAQLSVEPLPAEAIPAWFISLLGSGQAAEAVALLDQWQAVLSRMSADPAADPAQPPATVPLPLDLAMLRLAALEGDELAKAYQEVRDRVLAEAEADTAGSARAMWRVAVIAALFGQDLEQVDDYLIGAPDDSMEAVRARGWRHLYLEQADAARQVLGRAPNDPLCRLGLATLAGIDEAGQARAMLEVVHARPVGLSAAVALKRITAMPREVMPTPTGRSLVQLMDRQPNALWRMDLQRTSWLNVQIAVNPRRFAFREPIIATVTLRNNALLPLSLGAQRTVPSTALIRVLPSVSGVSVPSVPPTIADIGRRLTLKPGEEITIDVRLDQGGFGRFLDHFMYQTIAFSTDVIVDPRTGPGGALRPGPFGASNKVQVNQAWALPATEANVQVWLTQLDSPNTLEAYQALGRLASLNSADKPGAAQDIALIQSVADKLAERFKAMDAMRQAWTVIWLAPDPQETNPMLPLHEMALRSDDPLIRVAYLLSNVSDPQSPALAGALRHENRRIRDFAANYKVLLTKHAEEKQAAEAAAAQYPPPSAPPSAPTP